MNHMRSVIMFHGIQPEPSPLTISKEELASILEALKTNGYAVAPLAEVMAARPEDKVAALTFDNGFRSVLEAAEVLADFRATATLFVVTGWVGKTNRWPGQFEGTATHRLLDWHELGALRGGGWDIQAQSHNHPDMRSLPDKNAVRELETCKATLHEQLGVEATVFAYPYGFVNERVQELVRSRFDMAVTAMLSGVPDVCDPHLIPRIDGQFIWPKPVHHYFGRRRFWAYLQTRQQMRRWRSHPAEPNIAEWLNV